MDKKLFILTFGCQANKADSERIHSFYKQKGFSLTDSWEESDLIVINTCSVRQRAEDRVLGFLYKIKKYFKNKKRPQIIITGCMLHHGKDKLKKLLHPVDKIIEKDFFSFSIEPIRQDKKHAYIPISNGCNSYCTYCIVPFSRGREKSRPFDDIMREVYKVAEQGYEEITLLGQNVNSYGLEKVGISIRKKLLHDKNFKREDIPSNQSQYLKPNQTPPFVKLLQEISKIDKIKKIHFISANPWDFHDELIEEIGKNKKIDRYIHIAVQSGSNSVLYRMNRGYTREDYIELIQKLRSADPNLVFGTDIIVGFPQETDEEFMETVDLAHIIDWKIAFINIYSERPGTIAAKLYKDDVPYKIKKQRWKILDDLINKKNFDKRPKVT